MSVTAEKPASGRAELVLAIAVLGIIGLLILPLPPLLLDGFLAISISISVLILSSRCGC